MQNKKEMKRNSSKFLRTLNILIVLSFLIVVIFTSRIALTHRVGTTNLKEFVEQRSVESKILYAKRGTIRDTRGNLLAQTIPTYNLIAVLTEKASKSLEKDEPRLHVTDPSRFAREVSPIIGMNEADMLGIIETGKENSAWQVEFAPYGNRITQDQKDQIDALNLEGVEFTDVSSRSYPQSRFASHIIGYASYNQEHSKLEGVMGIESKLNDYLSGVDGLHEYQKDGTGMKLKEAPERIQEAIDGGDVYLTLDTSIQRMAETAMQEVEQMTTMKWASVIVANPKTGEIMAAAQSPSFDPNNYNEIKDFNNYIAETEFEVGSIMKPITFSSAIDAGHYDGNQGIMTGSVTVDGVKISDWWPSGWGVQAKDRGICYSANTITASVVLENLTKEEQLEYLKKFGFGQPTGIEMTDEASGKIISNSDLERVTTGFGQGSTATMVQMLQAYNAIANGGKMMQLHIVDRVVNPKTGEYIYKAEPKLKSTPISKQTADYMTQLMIETANDPKCASGDAYKMSSGVFAGKTGTAEVVNPETGKYYANSYTYTYAGFAPADDPQFVILAAVYLPENKLATTHLITSLHDKINRYLGASKDPQFNNETPIGQNVDTIINIDSFPSFLNVNVEQFREYAQAISARQVVVLGTGDTIIEQNIEPYTPYLNTTRIIVRTNSPEIVYPDFNGWSRKDIESFAKVADIDVQFDGYGYSHAQSVAPGTVINDETRSITINLVV